MRKCKNCNHQIGWVEGIGWLHRGRDTYCRKGLSCGCKNPELEVEKMNNQYGYIGEPQYCDCGGILVYYDGLLGYESLVCNKCKKDISKTEPEPQIKVSAWELEELDKKLDKKIQKAEKQTENFFAGD